MATHAVADDEQLVEIQELDNLNENTQEAFDIELLKYLDGLSIMTILRVPGVYEALSEEYNNEVLEILEKKGLWKEE